MKPLRAPMVRFAFTLFTFAAALAAPAANRGLQFDGSNDQVTFGPAPQLGLGQFTIEAWIKRTGAGATASTGTGGLTAVPVVAKGRGEADNSNKDMNWFLGITTANQLAADFEEGATGKKPGFNHPVTGVTALALNTWYHVAATYNGSKWQLFVNGALDKELTVGQPPRADSIQHASLGTALNSTGVAEGFFAGVLDEVRIWNYARSAAEIQGAMAQVIASAPGLLGRWALDETSGTVAADSSGSGVNGTLLNGPAWCEGYPFVPAPAVQLLAPANQSLASTRNVTFTVAAQDQAALASATLYLGQAPQTLVLSGPAETVDTYLSADAPTMNYDSSLTIKVDGATPHAHGLIKFPNLFGAGRIAPGATIASATLKVNCSNFGALMKAYRLTQDWEESAATWNQRTATEAWANPGADGAGSHAATALDADCTATGWRTIDVTALVQEWSSGAPNYGLLLTDTGTDGVDLATSESASPPELTVVVASAPPQAVETKEISGTSATVTFDRVLDDNQSYVWNCLVLNAGGESAWASASFNLSVDCNYPAFPSLVGPADQATGIALAPSLTATVSDPNGGPLDVVFYGRKAQADTPDFTVAVLPDTQNYSQSYPSIFTAQTQWLVNQKAARNIVFVAQAGDVVNTASDAGQYANANASLSLLDGVLPYGLAPGNHDLPSTLFNQTFPYTRYQANAWYGDHYPADANDSNYQLFEVGSLRFIVLHLVYLPASDVVAWADAVLKTHADRKAIIVTHAYLDVSGNRTDGSGVNTEYLWTGLVVPNPNVCLMLCGHEPAEQTRVDSANGRMVPQMLADYQARANGGNGWLRLMRFSPAQNKVFVETYSPYLNQFEEDADSKFTLDLPLNEYQVIATQSGVASGTDSTAAWTGLEANTRYEWYVKATDPTSRSTQSPVWSFTTGNGVTTPVAYPQSVAVDEDTPKAITLAGYDPNGQPLEYTVEAAPQNGTLSGDAPNLLYTPAAEFSGADSFTFSVNGSDPATVAITVAPVNDAPEATAQTLVVDEDTSLAIVLSATDVDSANLTSSIAQQPAHGVVMSDTEGWLYVPTANFNGTDSFTFTVSDGTATSVAATVAITVNAVNDAPTAAGQALGVEAGAALAIALAYADVDGDALTCEITTLPALGTLSGEAPNLNYAAGPTVGTDSFTFTVSDGKGGSAEATVVITIAAVNHPPTAADQTVRLDEDTAAAITLGGTDPDGDPLTYAVVSGPANGVLTGAGPNLSYTPGPNFNGQDQFTFTVSDGKGGVAQGTVTLTVNSINDAPATAADAYSVNQNAVLNVAAPGLLANDTDVEGEVLTATVVTGPAHGTLAVNPDGSFTYTPTPGYSGADSFTYAASDGQAETQANVAITVNPVVVQAVHVENIAVTLESKVTKGVTTYRGIGVVTIQNHSGQAASGAVVTGEWLLNGAVVQAGVTGTTGRTGAVTLRSNFMAARSGDVLAFRVTGVSLTNYAYDPAANTLTTGSTTVP